MARKSRKTTEEKAVLTAENCGYRAAGYVRLSVEDSNHKGDSIESQKSIIENFIATEPDIELTDFYIDNGVSGRVFERIAFQKMLCDCESGKINCVICKDLSRAGRSAIDTGYYIEKYFPSLNVRFIAINDDFDSLRDVDNGVGIMLPLKNMLNEAYALDISRKVKAQQHEMMLRGEFVGARPPYGYVKDPNNCHKLIVDPESAEIVKMIFEWASEGDGLNTMVLKLNEMGIETPNIYSQRKGIINFRNLSGNGFWQTHSISRILCDEAYVGDLVQGKHNHKNRQQTPVPPEEWVIVKDTHEAIISRELFEKVQKIRIDVAENCKSRNVNPYSPNIFKGKVFCGYCGGSMHRNRGWKQKAKNNYVYTFTCLANSRKAHGSCVSGCTREDILIPTLINAIEKQAEIILGKGLKIKSCDKNIQKEKEKIKAEITELKSQISKNNRLTKSLYENLVTGIITAEEYKIFHNKYENQTAENQKIISEKSERLRVIDSQKEQFILFSDLLKSAKNRGLTAEIIDGLIEKIRIFKDNKIEVDFKFQSVFGEVLSNE